MQIQWVRIGPVPNPQQRESVAGYARRTEIQGHVEVSSAAMDIDAGCYKSLRALLKDGCLLLKNRNRLCHAARFWDLAPEVV